MRTQWCHGIRPLDLPCGQAVAAQGDAGMIDPGAQHARQFQRPGVDIHDMTTGMHDADRARGCHTIEILSRHPTVVEVDGIERPACQRLLRVGQSGSMRSKYPQ